VCVQHFEIHILHPDSIHFPLDTADDASQEQLSSDV